MKTFKLQDMANWKLSNSIWNWVVIEKSILKTSNICNNFSNPF